MASFSGVLGTIFSGLGNFVLGDTGGSGNVLENSITIAGTASYSTSFTYETNASITIACTAFIGPQDYFVTITIAGVASVNGYIPLASDFTGIPGTFRSKPGNVVPGMVPTATGTTYNNSIELDGVSSYDQIVGNAKGNSISIDGVASAAVSTFVGAANSLSLSGTAALLTSTFNIFLNTLPLSVTASIDIVVERVMHFAQTLSATSSYITPGGIVYNKSIELTATFFASMLAGFGYPEALDLDVTSSAATSEEYFIQLATTIAGVSSVDTTGLGALKGTLVAAAVASAAITTAVDFVLTTHYNVTSTYAPENIYNVLLPLTVISSVTDVIAAFPGGNETAASVGSISITSQVIHNRIVAQTLTMSQTVRGFHSTNVERQTFVMAQTATATKASIQSVSQTFSMTQQAFRILPISQTLVIIQTVAVKHVHNIAVQQTLVMTQQATTASVFHRTATDTLVFNPNKIIQLPLFGQQASVQPPGQFGYAFQSAYVYKIGAKCTVILSVPQRSIVLPCPQLGDTQAYTGSMTLKRTMTGDTLTYVKKSKTNKLKYLFWLGRQKGLELRDFLIAHNSQVITLVNWKGETWYGFLTSNPFDLVTAERWQNTGERVDVTLEFEGIKIGG